MRCVYYIISAAIDNTILPAGLRHSRLPQSGTMGVLSSKFGTSKVLLLSFETSDESSCGSFLLCQCGHDIINRKGSLWGTPLQKETDHVRDCCPSSVEMVDAYRAHLAAWLWNGESNQRDVEHTYTATHPDLASLPHSDVDRRAHHSPDRNGGNTNTTGRHFAGKSAATHRRGSRGDYRNRDAGANANAHSGAAQFLLEQIQC